MTIRARSASLLLLVGTAAAFTPGCIIKGMRYTDPITSGHSQARVPNATSCQVLCANDTQCAGFTYYPSSGECWFSQSGASTSLQIGTSPLAYAGPRTCPNPSPACPASIEADWPKSTVAESVAAFNVGYQPAKLQCWPMTAYNGSYGDCPEVMTLDSTEVGWPGRCLGLTQVTLSGGQTCEGSCRANVECPGFQVGDDGSCWQGVGMGCYNDASWNNSWSPTLAKRFQRGQVHVIKDMKGLQVLGLQRVFDKANMDLMTDPVSQCKKYCYSILMCQYWQLNNQTGCWVERPDVAPVEYPLTNAGVLYNSSYAPFMIAGEYIQRTCLLPTTTLPPMPSPTTTTSTTTTTEAAGGFPWWGWLLLALLICCCLAAIAAFLLCGGQKSNRKPKKKKRELASTPAAFAPTVPLVQAQPVSTVHQMMPVYTVAPAPVALVPAAQSRSVPMFQQAVPVAQPTPVMAPPAMGAPQFAGGFDSVDRNHDGVITREEFQRAMGGR